MNVRNNGVCVTHGARIRICSAEGCSSQAKGRNGLCQTHNNSNGSAPNCTTNARKEHKKHSICTFAGCNERQLNYGYCRKHLGKYMPGDGMSKDNTPSICIPTATCHAVENSDFEEEDSDLAEECGREEQILQKQPTPICILIGCNEQQLKHGYCRKHLRMWMPLEVMSQNKTPSDGTPTTTCHAVETSD
eukprot:CAMPEP_0183743438 /NCGR_PEP_ID=MMETSP0737-20130205/65219_1 /TAXON_ID=385413 /ORGANISM="Thalassiosira miniscula, Strain CCMP1093" /LENGTH=189 /DNA_ID=CAMNT_0025979057 /DNA_START=1612 /DNA_END=2178 /DNA_ORIENTATION=-